MIFPDKEVSEISDFAYDNKITLLGRKRFESWVQTLNKTQLQESLKLHSALLKMTLKTGTLGTVFALSSGILASEPVLPFYVQVSLASFSALNALIGAASVYFGSAAGDARQTINKALAQSL